MLFDLEGMLFGRWWGNLDRERTGHGFESRRKGEKQKYRIVTVK